MLPLCLVSGGCEALLTSAPGLRCIASVESVGAASVTPRHENRRDSRGRRRRDSGPGLRESEWDSVKTAMWRGPGHSLAHHSYLFPHNCSHPATCTVVLTNSHNIPFNSLHPGNHLWHSVEYPQWNAAAEGMTHEESPCLRWPRQRGCTRPSQNKNKKSQLWNCLWSQSGLFKSSVFSCFIQCQSWCKQCQV